SEVVKLECCDINFQAKNKEEALKKISELLVKTSDLKDIGEEKIYQALKEREDQGSTGFGKGIAIPHCQLEETEKFVISIAINKKGTEFECLDKKKAKIFITIVGPKTNRSGHLQLLAKVSRILKEPGVLEHLLKATSKIGLYEDFIRNAVDEVTEISKKEKDKLMLMIVKDDEIMQDISELFIEYGIQDATILESQKMENLLSNVPLFLGFFDFTGGKSPYSKIILLKINKEYIHAIVKGLEDIFGDLDNYTDLSIMVLDIFYAKGF
ncbi:MAG TPA: PTS sugar transporter subunit IIA, partial [Candidatus Cloacimonetes bacterium]|nr:PTS sugar transporter subunit IIA [Candidatus Cloacimonadota bacterium]